MDEHSSPSPEKLIRDLQENFKREQEGAALYRHMAELEKNPVKKAILLKLGQQKAGTPSAGRRCSRSWEARFQEIG